MPSIAEEYLPEWASAWWKSNSTDVMTLVLACVICGMIYYMVSPEQNEFVLSQRREARAKMKAAKKERRRAAAEAAAAATRQSIASRYDTLRVHAWLPNF